MTQAGFRAALAAAAIATGMAAPGAGWAASPAASSWQPGHVEFVVPAGPGAALDAAARTLAQLAQQTGKVPAMIVTNRPGGAGVIALNVLEQHPGDGNYLMTLTSSLLNNQILGVVDRDYRDYTPIAKLFDEYVAVVVSAKSPYQTLDALLKAMRENPAALNIGVATSIGNHIHVGIAKPLKAAGVDIGKLTIVPYKSSAESMTALIGGHLDIVAATTPNLLGPLQAGAIRVLAVSSPQRLQGELASIPTWREQGVDAVSVSAQGILGPRGMTPQQVAFWDGLLRQVVQTPAWEDVLQRNQWRGDYIGPGEVRDYLAREFDGTRAILADLGLVEP
ncbi:tripartite tricarboxylate transporter substrate binding protein [Verticiella sediminum]|uniref:Tripartite tricarboxylate transporter substrate binding protein n=1 Tax=Verticiella sediminum TaxID=1247510 RepID=A0A556AYW1_9BURK|nr:tripartite tricarboxylate transporter substrate binding protein [Verticiella sediminum]TSH98108.1 tripartite tricarboxylate transporter substrate binding protein [Verticiella sediminum]